MKYADLDDWEFFRLLAEGHADAEAWRHFVDRFHRSCYHAIHRVIARRADMGPIEVEEVFQRFFERILDHDYGLLRRFRGDNGCAPRTYLAHLATYQALDFVRQHDRRSRRMTHLDSTQAHKQKASPEASADERLVQGELARKVRQVVDSLRPDDKLLYQLHYEQGLTLVEIARALNKSDGALQVQHFRLKERIRRKLQGDSESLEVE